MLCHQLWAQAFLLLVLGSLTMIHQTIIELAALVGLVQLEARKSHSPWPVAVLTHPWMVAGVKDSTDTKWTSIGKLQPHLLRTVSECINAHLHDCIREHLYMRLASKVICDSYTSISRTGNRLAFA